MHGCSVRVIIQLINYNYYAISCALGHTKIIINLGMHRLCSNWNFGVLYLKFIVQGEKGINFVNLISGVGLKPWYIGVTRKYYSMSTYKKSPDF